LKGGGIAGPRAGQAKDANQIEIAVEPINLDGANAFFPWEKLGEVQFGNSLV